MPMSINNGTASYHNTHVLIAWCLKICYFNTNTGNQFFIILVKKVSQIKATIPLLYPTKYRSHHYMLQGKWKCKRPGRDCGLSFLSPLNFQNLKDQKIMKDLGQTYTFLPSQDLNKGLGEDQRQPFCKHSKVPTQSLLCEKSHRMDIKRIVCRLKGKHRTEQGVHMDISRTYRWELMGSHRGKVQFYPTFILIW